jgi:putative chitinase
MSFQINTNQLSQFVPTLAATDVQALTDAINAAAAKNGIDQSPRRLRYFVAQSAFETQNFTFWSENLNYTTPQRLVAVWPSRFSMDPNSSLAYAPKYTNNPQALANLVYANRGGNGDQNSGDGFRFRGRGGFHLTFSNNYAAYSQAQYGDSRIVLNPDQVAAPTDAMASAGWFWTTNGLNAHADADEFTATTTIINGSAVTVPQRLPVLNRANSIFTWS